MKRFHVHVSVEDLAHSLKFYSALFGAEPAVVKADYAKWMLDDPRINFAISQCGAAVGVDHLGIQVDSAEELAALQAQFQAADAASISEPGTACCYAESDKHWARDPAGIAWEGYHTLATIPTFNQGQGVAEASACCSPVLKPVAMKITPKNSCAPGSGCC